MIKSIQLENFQSHQHTILKFCPGIISIIGSSDSGKTAILRGLRKAIKNKPGGDSFRSNWGGDTFIKVETDDEAAVTRTITDSKNAYHLDTPNNTEEFKAFGQGVPSEITDAFNMDDENIQSQMDAPFLFSASDGEVARRLNEAANLKKIDRSQSYLDKKIRACNAEIKQNKKDLKDTKDKLSSTEFIEEAETSLILIEKLEKDCKNQEQNTADLGYTLVSIQEADQEINELNFLENAQDLYNELEDLLPEYSKQETSIFILDGLLGEIDDINTSLEVCVDTEAALKSIDLLLSYSEGVDEKEKSIDLLNNIINDLKDFIEEHDDLIESIKTNQEKFDKLMPDVCPLCDE